MKRITALILFPVAGSVLATPFPAGDAQHEQNLVAYLKQRYCNFK